MKKLIALLLLTACSHNQESPNDKPETTLPAPSPTVSAEPPVGGDKPELVGPKSFAVAYHGDVPDKDRDLYILDLFEHSASDIARLSKRSLVGCYLSSQYESWRPDAKSWPKEAIGNCIKRGLGCWPDENWVNLNNDAIKTIMIKRIELAKSKGCQFLDFDNADGYDNKGSGQTKQQNIDYVKFLSEETRKRGMYFSQKNAVGLINDLAPYVDLYFNESCGEYSECDKYKHIKKPVMGVTYGSCYTYPWMYVIKKGEMNHKDKVCE